MKNSNFKIHFIKTVFNTYPIISIDAAEKHIAVYFKDNIIKHHSADILDVLYSDEIRAINLENVKEGNYILEGEIIIVHLYNSSDFEFVNLKLYKDKK
jgi:hypothetical protein